jgi:hypothetical protein
MQRTPQRTLKPRRSGTPPASARPRRLPRAWLAMSLFALSALALLTCASPPQAHANGGYTHIYISQLAVALLPPGPLRDLLTDPAFTYAYQAGSIFPDSGYAADDDYGEQAHWAPFQEAYLEHLRDLYQGDYSAEAARAQVAFLMGMASHGLADQIYDTTLLARAFAMGDAADGDFDRLADYFVILDIGARLSVRPWAPYADISAVFRDRVGYAVSEATLTRGMEIMSGVVTLQPRAARNEYLSTWALYPWLGTHINNPAAPGSLPHLGDLVASHWLTLWDRLHGVASIDTHLLTATLPLADAQNFPVDPALSPYHRVGLVFGYGVSRAQIQDKLRLLDPSGAAVPTRLLTPYNGDLRYFMMLEPIDPLAFNTRYTVELSPGVESLQGERSAITYRASFTTQCDPDAPDACPPLPPPLVAGPIPTTVPSPPPAEDTASTTEDTSPTAQDTSPTAQDTSPTAQDTSPTAQDTSPTAQDTSPTAQDISPTVEDTSPPAQDTSSSGQCACASARRPASGGAGAWLWGGLLAGFAATTRRRRRRGRP